MEYSQIVKSDWTKLFDSFEINRRILEKQSFDVQSAQDRLMELTKTVLDLPAKYNEQLKRREEKLKAYVEKCDFLEKQKSNTDKQIEEFSHMLLKIAQDQVELLQRKSECEEALKNIKTDKECEEENMFSEINECLEKNTTAITSQAEEAEAINEKIGKSTANLIKNTEEVVNIYFFSFSS